MLGSLVLHTFMFRKWHQFITILELRYDYLRFSIKELHYRTYT